MSPSRDSRLVAATTAWFADAARDLPWRRPECGAWGIVVSEVMLQQTPVVRVLPVWQLWMQRWPTPADLAAAPLAEVLRAWDRLGYPRRAKRLWECAAAITEHHGGVVPQSREELLALPGVGDYTAAAVMSFAYGKRAVVLDTNVRRVIARAWSGKPLPGASVTAAERTLAERLAPEDDASAALWAAASMELGALVCTARNPRCEQCPIAEDCTWLAAGKPGRDTAPRRTQAWHGTDRQVRGRIMAQLRAASEPLHIEGRADLSDIPPGQVEACLEALIADGLVTWSDPERRLAELA